MGVPLGVFRFQKILKIIAYWAVFHDFGLFESNGTIHFALQVRERLPQSAWSYPPKVALRAQRVRPAALRPSASWPAQPKISVFLVGLG